MDPKQMIPEDLFIYYSNTDGDSELFELVPMLPLAVGGIGKTYKILEKIQKGAKLVAFYPGEGEKEPQGEFLGPVYDGSLYLVE